MLQWLNKMYFQWLFKPNLFRWLFKPNLFQWLFKPNLKSEHTNGEGTKPQDIKRNQCILKRTIRLLCTRVEKHQYISTAVMMEQYQVMHVYTKFSMQISSLEIANSTELEAYLWEITNLICQNQWQRSPPVEAYWITMPLHH